ncbi:conserved protein of unknown function [Pseudodesulfovibrio profundus]|uniref:Helix-turn-helix domain-containing protein n=1 Tax=Pseudodesulfovibrio profundus TaxID=57320 RepID=A0A2C8FBP1_9BACT|nr:helix-turn-helix domain-containing protein [Pseudodesulfovibrio profundus]SOB59847.1 conserved protein of unknown function [Pseudodesulfovibrio profundus]
MSRPITVERQFYTQKEAAEYCGYCVVTFRQFAKDYEIPKCGPKRDRYRKEDLDDFMTNPTSFHNPVRTRRHGHAQVVV